MYTNLTRAQGFPRVAKISPGSKCFQSSHDLKTQCLPFCSAPKPSQNPMLKNPNFHSRKARNKIGSFCLMNPVRLSTELLLQGTLEMGNLVRSRHISYGLLLKISGRYCLSLRPRSFSSSYTGKVSGRISVGRAGEELPWLASNEVREAREPGKTKMTNIRGSIHEELAKKEKKFSNSSSGEESLKKSGKLNYRSSWEESIQRLENSTIPESGHSTKGDISAAAIKESRNGSIKILGEQRSDYGGRHGKFDDDDEDETEEAIDNPRWGNIKNKFKGLVGGRAGSERPELRRWNKQDNWGRKTWKEATQSTVPKIVGEGVYGVGPVLAALSAGRREFYALYVQEGLDFCSNNRKKKDKKGFERVLKIAEKIGLSVKEVSKHDLNMVVDNRPHQGLVLDASPLEMVKIKELDPISIEEGRGCLWVALDEVTDPQNLGAIIRSAYYFGASGIVLCAKNSAPLSGVVSKASAGSLELMELRYCKNMMQFLVSSSENGWRALGGSVSSKAVSLDEIVPGPPTILVLGSEGTGLRPLVEKSCTHLVRIPGNFPVDLTASELDGETIGLNNGEISGREFQSFLAVESLNVSVAAGVLLHHLTGKKLEASLSVVRVMHMNET